MSIFLLIIGIVLFIFLVIAHEFGHFIAARRNGVDVEEFGIFFPPRIWSKKMKSGFTFSINALPLGGFVRLKGEHDSDKGKGSFGEATVWAKTKIMGAGVGMNLLVAFVILTILAFVGMPQIINNQFTIKTDTKTVPQKVLVEQVESNSPASSIGLQDKDVLVAIGPINGTVQKINNANNLPSTTADLAGQTIQLTYLNTQGQSVTKTVKLRTKQVVLASQSTKKPIGYLGISTIGSPNSFVIQRSTWSAPLVALGLMWQIVVLTFQGLWHAIYSIFVGHPSQASQQVTGPVGVVVLLKNGSQLGYQFTLFIVAVISLSLAIINILPIPALDGGRIFFTYLPRLFKRKPLKQSTEEWIHGSGLAFLMLLFVLITIVDIKRYF